MGSHNLLRHSSTINTLTSGAFHDVPVLSEAGMNQLKDKMQGNLTVLCHGTAPHNVTSIALHGYGGWDLQDYTVNGWQLPPGAEYMNQLPGGFHRPTYFSRREECAAGYPQDRKKTYPGERLSLDDTRPVRVIMYNVADCKNRRWYRHAGTNDQQVYLAPNVFLWKVRVIGLPAEACPQCWLNPGHTETACADAILAAS